MWLAPTQVIVMPLTDRHGDYSSGVYEKLRSEGFRVELDARNEKIGYKIREAQELKIPYMLILGDREIKSGDIAVRHRKDGDLGVMPIDQFIDRCRDEVKTKKMD